MDVTLETTWRAAVAVRNHAYAPYSGYRVGAAVRVTGVADPVAGCNVENASYGGTLCAERVAITRAIAGHGPRIHLEHLVLVTETPAPPCGLCLQVLSEFVSGDFPIYTATPNGVHTRYTLDALLPVRFQPENLKK